MTIQAQLADGRTLEFPDGTDPMVIQSTVKKMIGAQPQQSTLDKIGDALSNAPANQVGLMENLGSLVSGAIAEPIAGLAGIAQSINPFAEQGAGARAVEATREALTYQPRTDAGKRQQESLGGAIQGAGESITENILKPLGVNDLAGKTLESTGSPLAATLVASLPTALSELIPGGIALKRANQLAKSSKAARQLIAEEIKKGNPNIDLVTKTLDESGRIVTNKSAAQAVGALGGDIKAKQTVSVIENMNAASKNQLGKALDIIEKGRREPIFGQTNRPSDVIGDSLSNRVQAINNINQKARSNIGEAANELKGKAIDITSARDKFFADMQDLGVGFKSENGRIKANFDNSTFVGGGADKIERIANAIKTGRMDGLNAHRQKQFIRDLVSFGKGTESAVSSRSQGIFKKLASGIDEVLDGTSARYKKANDNFAKTIELVEQFDKMAGKDIDIFSDLSKKSLGGKARRLVSNAESRVNIEQQILNADKVLGDFGVRFKDDIPSLSFAVTQLENIFKIEPAGSFQGRIERAGANLMQGQSATGAVASSAIDKLKEIRQPDFEKKMRALRLLTKVINNG